MCLLKGRRPMMGLSWIRQVAATNVCSPLSGSATISGVMVAYLVFHLSAALLEGLAFGIALLV